MVNPPKWAICLALETYYVFVYKMTLLTWPSCHEIRTRCIMTTAGVLNHSMINVRKVSVPNAKIQIDRRLIFCAGFSATCFCSNKWQRKTTPVVSSSSSSLHDDALGKNTFLR